MTNDPNVVIVNDKEISKEEIIANAQEFFRNKIVKSHKKNTLKLTNINEFNVNPFLNKYLAQFLTGNTSPESIAKALVYPRVLGSSITTTFGMHIQTFLSDVLGTTGSVVQGMDIEFIDKLDGHKKYCQVKAGPNTINRGDVEPIKQAFRDIINLGRTNNLRIHSDDCIVGVLYGSSDDLSGFYKEINKDYPVYTGQDFWHHLTGDEDFYDKISDAMASVVEEFDGTEMLEQVIKELSAQIEQEEGF